MRCRPNYRSGFTLIEVMIVVVIVAILAAVAIPSYVESVSRAARADARAAMMTMMQQQERFFSQSNTYQAVSNSSANATFKNWSGDGTHAAAKWILSAAACAGDGITDCIAITAVPHISVWTDATVSSMNFTSRGQATCTPSGLSVSTCWPR